MHFLQSLWNKIHHSGEGYGFLINRKQGDYMIAPMPVKQVWRMWLNDSHKFTKNYGIAKPKHNHSLCLSIIYCVQFILIFP